MRGDEAEARVPHVVIVGGGFGGLEAAKQLKDAPVEVTLIDRRNFHLFQPLLYQVATGALSPANIASPLRAVLKRQRNTRVWMAEVIDFDVASRRVIFADGSVPLCNVDYHNKYPLGNVHESSIETLWQSKLQNDRREEHLNDARTGICKGCDVWAEEVMKKAA